MIGRKIVACALACAPGMAGAAVEGNPIPNITVKGGCNPWPNDPCPHKSHKADSIVVQLNLGRTESWTYEPGKGTLAPSSARSDSAPPIIGVGVVVKKNPGGGASMVVPVGETGEAPLPRLADGTYNVTIRVPGAAFSTPPRGGGERGVELVFTFVKRGDSLVNLVQPVVNNKGTGSPKAQGF